MGWDTPLSQYMYSISGLWVLCLFYYICCLLLLLDARVGAGVTGRGRAKREREQRMVSFPQRASVVCSAKCQAGNGEAIHAEPMTRDWSRNSHTAFPILHWKIGLNSDCLPYKQV